MKTIIAGSRTCTDINHIMSAIADCGWIPTEIISGTARGVDQLGETWAIANNTPLKRFPADWTKHGKSAGYIRNVEMAENADALIAIWDGVSRGTKHMIDIATQKGLKVFVYRFEMQS
jgi:hypothetical protein